jgi:hypothetical protein
MGTGSSVHDLIECHGFVGAPLRHFFLQAATRSCGMTMSAADTEGVSRRAALGAFLAGAAAIPGNFSFNL